MDCATNHIPLTKQLEAMARTSGVFVGLPIVEVEVDTHEENAMRCDNNHLTLEDLLKACIGTDVCGKPALRVKFIDSCDTLVTCGKNHDADVFRKMFCYDSTAKTYALVINQSSE